MNRPNRIERIDWVYWAVLIFLVGEGCYRVLSTVKGFGKLFAANPDYSALGLFWELWLSSGSVKFLAYYVIGPLGIALSLVVVMLLLARSKMAIKWFVLSAIVAFLGVLLLILIAGVIGNSREIIGQIGAFLGLAFQMGLLYLGLRHICSEGLSEMHTQA